MVCYEPGDFYSNNPFSKSFYDLFKFRENGIKFKTCQVWNF